MKIVSICLDVEEKEAIFDYLQRCGAKIQDHAINFETNELLISVVVSEEERVKLYAAVSSKQEKLNVLSSSRGGSIKRKEK